MRVGVVVVGHGAQLASMGEMRWFTLTRAHRLLVLLVIT
jgi:hypothetical protein